MPRKTHNQAATLAAMNAERLKRTMRYAFRMRPFILRWESEGESQRGIVALLNEAGAPVPSEYTGDPYRPAKGKQWSLIQYQRFRKLAEGAAERMKWYAVKKRAPHTRPYGDGRGLFRYPEVVGLPHSINRRRQTGAKEEREEAKAAQAERMKDPRYRQLREEADAVFARIWDAIDNGLPYEPPPPERVGELTLPHPDTFIYERIVLGRRQKRKRS